MNWSRCFVLPLAVWGAAALAQEGTEVGRFRLSAGKVTTWTRALDGVPFAAGNKNWKGRVLVEVSRTPAGRVQAVVSFRAQDQNTTAGPAEINPGQTLSFRPGRDFPADFFGPGVPLELTFDPQSR